MQKLKDLLPKHSNFTIMLDMDGVLCDFDTQFRKLLSDDVVFGAAVSRPKLVSAKKLSDLNLTLPQFIDKCDEIRTKVLRSNHSDIYGLFKSETKSQLKVPLSWSFVAAGKTTFWSTMKWMPDGPQLIDQLRAFNVPIQILTAGSRSNTDFCSVGKRQWLSNNGLGDLPFNIVSMGTEKYKYATPTRLLIDDTAKNVELFIGSGGQGIVHTSTKSTINQLR